MYSVLLDNFHYQHFFCCSFASLYFTRCWSLFHLSCLWFPCRPHVAKSHRRQHRHSSLILCRLRELWMERAAEEWRGGEHNTRAYDNWKLEENWSTWNLIYDFVFLLALLLRARSCFVLELNGFARVMQIEINLHLLTESHKRRVLRTIADSYS